MTAIPGDPYSLTLPASPVTQADLDGLLATLGWTDADAAALREAGSILEPQIEAVLDTWYGFVGSHPHLLAYFNGADGTPSTDYLQAVRARFGQWIRDLCARPRDSRWLAAQHEIARRHACAMGETDGIATQHTYIPLRYMIAFVVPITATIRDFLAAGTDDPAKIDAMHAAWFKAVALTVALWAQPYAPERW